MRIFCWLNNPLKIIKKSKPKKASFMLMFGKIPHHDFVSTSIWSFLLKIIRNCHFNVCAPFSKTVPLRIKDFYHSLPILGSLYYPDVISIYFLRLSVEIDLLQKRKIVQHHVVTLDTKAVWRLHFDINQIQVCTCDLNCNNSSLQMKLHTMLMNQLWWFKLAKFHLLQCMTNLHSCGF
jgi:hypothetical protein